MNAHAPDLHARALIDWGTTPGQAYTTLREDGVSAADAAALIQAARDRRVSYYRSLGASGIVVGVCILVVSLLVMYVANTNGYTVRGRGSPEFNRLMVGVVGMLYGCGRIVLGLRSYFVDATATTPCVASDDGLSF